MTSVPIHVGEPLTNQPVADTRLPDLIVASVPEGASFEPQFSRILVDSADAAVERIPVDSVELCSSG